MQTSYYLAYGSNLNRAKMAKRCPDAQAVGWAKLTNWQLCFRYWADIEPAPGQQVYAGIYRITERCEQALDGYEEFPQVYDKCFLTIPVFLEQQPYKQALPVMFYRMHPTAYQAPSVDYLQEIKQGFLDFLFPTTPLNRALAQVFS
ncbi:gamma-glutamylcyclotransferase family protein [Magnetococcus sp. PR-3]|uniref:gamma-glutamylcyclotransferase family protein n=1 Tax=Magnetococcus sp. PR-3 TaxID=3120355 RepID=UPI002FCE5BF0